MNSILIIVKHLVSVLKVLSELILVGSHFGLARSASNLKMIFSVHGLNRSAVGMCLLQVPVNVIGPLFADVRPLAHSNDNIVILFGILRACILTVSFNKTAIIKKLLSVELCLIILFIPSELQPTFNFGLILFVGFNIFLTKLSLIGRLPTKLRLLIHPRPTLIRRNLKLILARSITRLVQISLSLVRRLHRPQIKMRRPQLFHCRLGQVVRLNGFCSVVLLVYCLHWLVRVAVAQN